MSGAPHTACPDPGVLDRFARGELAAEERARVEAHFDACAECMQIVCELAAGLSADPRARAEASAGASILTVDARGTIGRAAVLEVGSPIGRYRVHRRLGQGAMGVVYAAYDPELDRQVAIKLLHRDRGRELEAQRLRLVREAQAMAKLSHPNVVAVHDVGTHDGQLFLAMELVDGVTLGVWLRERNRSRDEILRAFVNAGRGLAAAHAVGLVHRDFKPDNVLIGRDARGVHAIDRVRVTDFGLARPQSGKDDAIGSPGAFLGSSAERALTMDLTAQGSMVGTPAYMAPEQFLGLDADARADQFSYCVALYEALFGKRPFAGSTLNELTLAVTEGRMTEPDAAIAAPKWLRRALLRGLAVQASARHRDMDALLAELDKDRAWRNRVIASAAVGGGAATLVGTAYLAAIAGLGSERVVVPEPAAIIAASSGCTRGEAKLARAWNDDRRAALAAEFTAGHPNGATKWREIEPTLTTWATDWSTMHFDACEATTVRHEQSAELMDLRMHCLDRAVRALDAALGTLARPDADTIARSQSVVATLPAVAHCADLERVREMATPVDHRDAIAQLAGELATIEALTRLGKYREALPVAEALVERAQAETGAKRVLAEAQFRRGSLQDKLDDHAGAEKSYVAAVMAARESEHDEVAMWGAINLVYNIGYQQRRPDDARLWIDAAESAVAKNADVEAEAALADYIGSVEFARGENEAALVQYRRGIALEEKLSGPDHPDVASKLYNMASVLLRMDQKDEALAMRQRALAIMLEHRAADHPQISDHLRGVAAVLLALDRHEEALEKFTRALEIRRAAYGEEHSAVATSLDDVGVALDELGREDEAVRSLEQALAMREKLLPAAHPDIAATRKRLAHARADAAAHGE